jgi:ribonuclease HII
MRWVLGIDEAGYGPNLGPFIMSAVACRVPDEPAEIDLWQHLASAVRRARDARDNRLVVDDSKLVYAGARGLGGLERGLGVLTPLPACLDDLLESLCPDDLADLGDEPWYTGTSALPMATDSADLDAIRDRFALACAEGNVDRWMVQSVVLCPLRFNALVARQDSKSAILGHGFIRLLRWAITQTGDEPLSVFIDKQGGRNTYAAQIQDALSAGAVLAVEESSARSIYRVAGLSRDLQLTFQPRADGSFFSVACASMVSKYLRELFMTEFNAFWQKQVPGLKPTAGYPGDASRFLDAIRPVARSLQIHEETIWRQR